MVTIEEPFAAWLFLLGRVALAVFTLVATAKVHHFWTMEGEQRLIISHVAMANVAVVGGLLVLAATSAMGLP